MNNIFKSISSAILLIYFSLSVSFQIFAQNNIALNRAAYHSSAANYDNTAHLITDGQLTTFWQSKNTATEWIYVDLGAELVFNEIRLHWDSLFAVQYKIQISNCGTKEKPTGWKDIYENRKGQGQNEIIKIKPVKARFVRLLCIKQAVQIGYSLKEFEIFGNAIIVEQKVTKSEISNDGKLYLHGTNWKLQRQAFVTGNGSEISNLAFNDKNWIDATVPGTILTSYLNIGAIPDPLYGDQQLQISESFFTANFWYSCKFTIPDEFKDKKIWLNFDGINWKAEIYVNGSKAGRIDGAYIRGKFDITQLVKIGQDNAIAVLIYKNDNPGEVTEQHLKDPDGNGGIIGYDSPTILASIGWNWIPTIRGRNTGIWNNVYLNSTKSVSIIDPYIITDFQLPDTSSSDVKLEVIIQNNDNQAVIGKLMCRFGNIEFEQNVDLKPLESKKIIIDKNTHPQLHVKNPKLWWPNGYGAQNIETLNLEFRVNSEISDRKQINFGFRKYSYSYDNNNLRILVNGVPLIIRGGNWGLPEAMMRCDNERFNILVKLHKDMNLNMIRNWLGMTGNDAFYEACDKYGIMIWDDFWLANPVDGPHPKDNAMFMSNVTDKIKNRRNHASLAIWCGRNEGYPPATLDSSMRVCLSELDNSRHYVSSSADRPVTGLGPYETKDPKWYFQQRGNTLHTEQGIVCVPPIESMKEMMPEEYLWPINDMWGKHDWTQPRVKIYTDDMDNCYGKATSLDDFCKKAQMLNMEGPKAMMESWQSNRGGGVIVWMTHPAWPSLICQTYDYFFEPTAAYFAFKKGSEPLHAMWRADNNKVQIANNTLQEFKSLTVKALLFDINGKLISEKSNSSNVLSNSVTDFLVMDYPDNISTVHFIKLHLVNKEGIVLSDNFYWRSAEYRNYKALNDLPIVTLSARVTKKATESITKLTITLSNNTSNIALMTRLKIIQKKSGKRVLPAFYQDNYFSMVPGEIKTVDIEFENKYLNGEECEMVIEGWNVIPQKINTFK